MTINNAEKGSNPRQLEISEKLVTMLKRIPQESELVFGPNANERMRRNFTQKRTRLHLNFRTQNQRIKKIHLHSFRHWYATMLYHHTKDIMLVKQKLGHQSITSTQVYVQLLQGHRKEEYVCKVSLYTINSIPKIMHIKAKMGLEMVIPIFFNPFSTASVIRFPSYSTFQNTIAV